MIMSLREKYLCLAAGFVTLALSAWAHIAAGLTLPTPWNDESWILWKALSFSETGSLFSQHINPERMVITFPAYETLLGIIFKFAPFTLETGRWISWMFMMISYAGWFFLLVRSGRPLIPFLLVSFFYLNATFTVAGNMIRPEAALMACTVWAFALLARNHIWLGASLVGLGVVLHPVGLMVTVGWLVAWLIYSRPFLKMPSQIEIIVFFAAAVAVCVWIIHIAVYWNEFQIDYGSASSEKMGLRISDRLFDIKRFPFLIIMFVALAGAIIGARSWVPVVIMGLTFMVIPAIRSQMWYEVYVHAGFLVLGLLWPLSIDAYECRKKLSGQKLISSPIYIALSLLGLLPISCFFLKHSLIEGPRGYPYEMQWGWGMRIYPHPYLDVHDRDAVAGHIRSIIGTNTNARVAFVPDAEAILFYPALKNHGSFYQPVRTEVKPDIVVLHESSMFAPWFKQQGIAYAFEQYGFSDTSLIYSSERGDRWYVKRLSRQAGDN